VRVKYRCNRKDRWIEFDHSQVDTWKVSIQEHGEHTTTKTHDDGSHRLLIGTLEERQDQRETCNDRSMVFERQAIETWNEFW